LSLYELNAITYWFYLGPTPLPLIGNMIDIAKAGPTPYEALHKLAKKYGDVMSVKLGVHDIGNYQLLIT